MSLPSRTRLGFYEILSLLGEGGMGEVYRARDTRLGRDVAIKVLPADVARDTTRLDRFRREAKALAAIDHPNIVTVFSVEEASSGAGTEILHFLTMQLIDGQSLDQVIPTSGLPLERMLAIGAAIADALAAAHDKSIVHRDLKPANVMVAADGRVKVLDFGLAKDLRPNDPANATLTSAGHTDYGVVMGMPAYMSPEQVAGRAVDHRSDIFSLGILLYQMASGARPFEGASSIELASAILRDTPPLITDVRSDLPADLARLIRRCLEKDPGQRIQTARDVANECRDLSRQVLPSSGAPATARRGGASGSSKTSPRQDEGFRVAILPFKYSGASADITSLAEGLAEEIVTGLSRFSYLRVMAGGSIRRDASIAIDAPGAGERLGARYVMEGSLRQAGSQLRVAVQLIDATTSAHLWAETYDRQLNPDQLFALQDDLVPRIVSTVADWYGVLPRSMSDSLRHLPVDQLGPYEAVLRSFGYSERRTPEEHRLGRQGLERAVLQADGYADAWALLSILHSEEYATGFNPQPDPLGRALDAARRAIDADPSNALGHFALARARFFRKEFPACRTSAEQALALNPMDGGTMAFIGVLLSYSGDWERGCGLVERAAALNPRHPGWYWFPLFLNAYRKSDYVGALRVALKINLPNFFFSHVMMAAVQGQLGDRAAAADALRELLALRPDFASKGRDDLEKWYPPDLVSHLIDGLRNAGLDVDGAGSTPAPARGRAAGDGKAPMSSIAVLPFTNMSADKDQDYFSDGLAEEVINLLAGVSGLRVIARTSSFAFRGKEQDIRGIADALGVTHVLEGSVRRAGSRVRVTAQLIAATDGGHLWSERYDREVSDIFALQDDIAAAITRALRISLSGEGARRYVPKPEAYEAYLKARHHQAKVTPDSWALAKTYYESAVELDPAYGLAHVGLGFYWLALPHFGRVSAHEAVPKARAAAETALRIDSSIPEAHAVLGCLASQYDFDWDAAERHFDAPMAREVGYPVTRPIYGGFLFMKGEPERAVELAERAIAEDPLEVWPRMNLHAYLQAVGRDREAFEQTQKVLELDPNLVIAWVSVAHFHADWGELAEAVNAAQKAYAVGPWYPDARATLAALLKRSGADDEARAMQQSLGSGDSYGEARALAVYHLLCGDVDTGADWTEKAIAERDFSMMYYLRFVVCKPLRASHRWPAIAKMINLRA